VHGGGARRAYAKRRGGFNTSLTVDVVEALEALLLAVDDSISALLISLYDHRFQDSHTHIADLHSQVRAPCWCARTMAPARCRQAPISGHRPVLLLLPLPPPLLLPLLPLPLPLRPV
jgi:hypothetical protein